MTCRPGIAPILPDRRPELAPRRERQDSGWFRIIRLALVIYLSPVILLVLALGSLLVLVNSLVCCIDRFGRSIRDRPPSPRGLTRPLGPTCAWSGHRPQGLAMPRKLRGLRRD